MIEQEWFDKYFEHENNKNALIIDQPSAADSYEDDKYVFFANVNGVICRYNKHTKRWC